MIYSPILTHALESFEHGLEHYIIGKNRDRKFAILHLDHAIELILKEKISRLGKVLFKTDGQTLNYHECLKSLSSIDIPEIPRLQDIHDTRNTIQHKGLNPDENATSFYVSEAYKFIKRFLKDELQIEIVDILPKEKLNIFESNKSAVLDGINDVLNNEADYLSMIINSYINLENYIRSLDLEIRNKGIREAIRTVARSRGDLGAKELKDLNFDLNQVIKYRSMVVHQNIKLDNDSVKEYVESMKRILSFIS